ncbi:hypothetical protein B5X24_HaOG204386 [Helicoverpa armigera]|uniref:Uncharacterized protein n=1 Tax=Helicoverpa armigera TaxID=29058 RepID=A0A2W1BNT6_HELAM|nr:hypothetical protein B5X24_HaOG204386 [Helicoverpa armigera]
MARVTVLLTLLFFVLDFAFSAPRRTKVTILRDSNVGYDFDAGDNRNKASGTYQGSKDVEIDLPEEAAIKAPEIILLENVNTGAGIALGGKVDVEAVKSHFFKFKNKDSTIGFALGAGGSKTAGIQIGNGNIKVQIKDVARKRPDFSFLENVNSGIAFGFDQSISIGVLKDNLFNGKNPIFGRK